MALKVEWWFLKDCKKIFCVFKSNVTTTIAIEIDANFLKSEKTICFRNCIRKHLWPSKAFWCFDLLLQKCAEMPLLQFLQWTTFWMAWPVILTPQCPYLLWLLYHGIWYIKQYALRPTYINLRNHICLSGSGRVLMDLLLLVLSQHCNLALLKISALTLTFFLKVFFAK